MRLFIVGAIVLIVFTIIATAQSGSNIVSASLFSVSWYTWLAAALLSFFADLLTGGWAWAVGPFARRDQPVA